MVSASAPSDDSDLEDLISKSPGAGTSKINAEIGSPYGSSASASPGLMNPLALASGACQLCCYRCPCLSKCFLSLAALGLLGYLSNTVFNPTRPLGVMGGDYSAVQSAFELSLSKVDHWCVRGDNDSCRCEDPLEPSPRAEFKAWNSAHKANVADVELYRAVYGAEPAAIDEATGRPRPPIDVVFLGESVVEAMDGRWLGKRVSRAERGFNAREGPEAGRKPDIGKLFDKYFRKETGAPVEGLALGIAGDNTASVLWRLLHDEMPYDFNPQVWWLVLGMNDLARMQCSEEIVVLGILRVVEEIRLRKPDAKIVINSLLPMIDFQNRQQPKMADFADFKRAKENAMRESIEVKNAKDKFFAAKAAKEAAASRGVTSQVIKGDGGSAGPKEQGGQRRQLEELNKRQQKKKEKAERKKAREKKKMEGGKEWKRKKRGESEDDATEGVALEKAMKRKEKKFDKIDKKVRNKVFRDNEKYHPKKPVAPGIPFIKKRVLPPVWPSVHVINAKLKEFCSKHEGITFFDATPIFASDEGRGGHRLRNELISPRGHPSELGFAVWEGNILGRLQQLLTDRPEKKIEPANQAAMEDGNIGEEHVSDGKESVEPPLVEQPSRSSPSGSKDSPGGKEPSGKESSRQEPSAREDSGKELSGREDSGEEPARKEDLGKESAGREDSGEELPSREATGKKAAGRVAPGKEISGREVPEKEPSDREESRKEPVRTEGSRKAPSGREAPRKELTNREASGKVPSGRGGSGMESARRENPGKGPIRREDNGKEPAAREDPGKASTDKEDNRKALADKEDTGKAPAGKEDPGKASIGREDSGKVPEGRDDSGRAPTVRKDSGKPADRMEDSGKTHAGSEDPGKVPSGVDDSSGGKKPSGNEGSSSSKN